MKINYRIVLLGLLIVGLAACAPASDEETATPAPREATDGPTVDSLPLPTAGTSLVSLPAKLTLRSRDWKTWPVLPGVTQTVRDIYLRGQELGNDPQAFSIFGDCQSVSDVFMGVYETDPEIVSALPANLQETVTYFKGSFNRESPTVKAGTTAGSLLWEQWHQGKLGCSFKETPVDCELRLHNPSFVFIHIGTHYEARNAVYLRTIIDELLSKGIVPILSTKADDRELDTRINHDTAVLAVEYKLPTWNFWAATGDLPNRGLYTKSVDAQLGDVYLNEEAQVIHRETALQSLDIVWRAAASK